MQSRKTLSSLGCNSYKLVPTVDANATIVVKSTIMWWVKSRVHIEPLDFWYQHKPYFHIQRLVYEVNWISHIPYPLICYLPMHLIYLCKIPTLRWYTRSLVFLALLHYYNTLTFHLECTINYPVLNPTQLSIIYALVVNLLIGQVFPRA